MTHTRPVLLSTLDEFGVWHTLTLNTLEGLLLTPTPQSPEGPISDFMYL